MKLMLNILLLIVAPSVFADQSIGFTAVSFQITANDAFEKLEKTILYPEGMLKRFTPVGAKISKKRVSQNEVSFVATKTALFISRSVYVNAILVSTIDNSVCPKNEIGYSLKMQFDSSDDLLTDNVEELEASICLKSQSSTKIIGVVRAKIILGNNYSNLLGPIAINLIKEQVNPLLDALTEEIKSLR